MGHLTTLGEERVKGGPERERKAFGWGSTWTGSRLFGARRWQLSSARLQEARGTDRKIHAHSAETSAKRPKQAAEEVCFSGDKLTTLLFQSLCLQVEAEAQAVSLHSVRECTSRDEGLSPAVHPWDFPGNSTGVGCHWLKIQFDLKLHSVIVCPMVSCTVSYSGGSGEQG